MDNLKASATNVSTQWARLVSMNKCLSVFVAWTWGRSIKTSVWSFWILACACAIPNNRVNVCPNISLRPLSLKLLIKIAAKAIGNPADLLVMRVPVFCIVSNSLSCQTDGSSRTEFVEEVWHLVQMEVKAGYIDEREPRWRICASWVNSRDPIFVRKLSRSEFEKGTESQIVLMISLASHISI